MHRTDDDHDFASPPPLGLPLDRYGMSVPIDLADRARASLLTGAIGDALGRPAEGAPLEAVRRRWGHITDFEPWHGHRSGPIGTITDDTQLTILTAESIIEGNGTIDPDDFAARLVVWLPDARGIGHATREAVERLTAGESWKVAGSASAGNGAAMRAAPIGIAHHSDPDRIRVEAARSSIITHNDPTAVLAAITHAFLVAWCLHQDARRSPADSLIESVEVALTGLADPAVRERHDRRADRETTFRARLFEVTDWLGRDVEDVIDHFWNGAFVIESYPVALWMFLRYWDDPETMLVEAASCGHDCDTIASMAGNLAGALHGTSWIPSRWRSQLEYRDKLVRLANRLVAIG